MWIRKPVSTPYEGQKCHGVAFLGRGLTLCSILQKNESLGARAEVFIATLPRYAQTELDP